MRHTILTVAATMGLTSLTFIGCKSEAPTDSGQVALSSFAYSEWSAPENLGATINSTASDQNATLTKDGLTLYFSSDRLVNGVNRGLDIWVSHRPTTSDPWGTPENLQAINTSAAELAPNLSIDGHLLFFTSNRPGSAGIDIWMSRRMNKDDDFSWGTPVRLGSAVNTASADQAPMYLQSAEDGSANLYFNRGVLAAGQGDIYYASITRDGETLGDSVAVTELNSSANDAAVSIRHDGKEIFFWSNRSGTQDLWTSTRQSQHDPWSPPTKLEAPISTASNELTPSLSFDGRTLIFSSNRTPTTGGNDLWMTTRTLSDD
jgi:WD40 repeat protein